MRTRLPRKCGELLPDVFVTTGTELTREWHEYERTSTVAANAYVGPQVSKYVAEFDAGLREQRLCRHRF